jgi:hypothetical protein
MLCSLTFSHDTSCINPCPGSKGGLDRGGGGGGSARRKGMRKNCLGGIVEKRGRINRKGLRGKV